MLAGLVRTAVRPGRGVYDWDGNCVYTFAFLYVMWCFCLHT